MALAQTHYTTFLYKIYFQFKINNFRIKIKKNDVFELENCLFLNQKIFDVFFFRLKVCHMHLNMYQINEFSWYASSQCLYKVRCRVSYLFSNMSWDFVSWLR